MARSSWTWTGPGISWRLDPRLPADQQTWERVYAANDLDRGHLVRRSSAVWGDTIAEAERANEDTFHYTNAAPQAAQYRSRVVVFTGPIFSDLDPVYRGVDIPLRFFKVAAFIHQGGLAATGYEVDQTPQLANMPDVPRPGAVEDVPPLSPFRTFQAPIRDIAKLTGLDLDQLITVDRTPIAVTLGAARGGSTWRELGASKTSIPISTWRTRLSGRRRHAARMTACHDHPGADAPTSFVGFQKGLARTVTAALRFAPGVRHRRSGGGSGRVVLRGLKEGW